MSENVGNNRATVTQIFDALEDDVVDELLAALKSTRFEELQMRYQLGELNAVRTDLHVNEEQEEVPVTYALAASWAGDEMQIELSITVDEAEHDWSEPLCHEVATQVMDLLKEKLPTIDVEDEWSGGSKPAYNAIQAEFDRSVNRERIDRN